MFPALWTAWTSTSPSSRRAWIEITLPSISIWVATVALLAEGVDRNILPSCQFWGHLVALLAEGVDRNGNTVNSH